MFSKKKQILEYKNDGYFKLNKDQRILLGSRAGILLRDETLERAFDECHTILVSSLLKTEPTDVKKRETLHCMVQSLNMTKDMLRAYYEDGKIEKVNENESKQST